MDMYSGCGRLSCAAGISYSRLELDGTKMGGGAGGFEKAESIEVPKAAAMLLPS